MLYRSKHLLTTAAVLSIIAAAGCSSDRAKPAETGSSPSAETYTGDPVELVIKDENSGIATDEAMKKVIVQLIETKHPNIRLTFAKDKIEDMLAAGSPPDLVATSHSALMKYRLLDVPADLSPVIQSMGFDLNRIEPVVMEAIKGFGTGGAIYGLPFGMNHGATIYNADLFDKFGVPYPSDTMTWEDFLELSRRMTRDEQDRHYVGGAPAWTIVNAFRQYGASSVDAKDERAALTTDEFRHVASLIQKFYQIPGLIQQNPATGKMDKYAYGNDDFFKAQSIAMYTGYIASHLTQIRSAQPTFKWDLAAYPVYKDRPNAGNPVDFHMLVVAQSSKHKDAAYWVLKTLLTEEAQLAISKAGRISVLKDTAIKQTFALDSGVFQGKNLSAIFKVPNAPLVRSDYSAYKDDIAPFIKTAVEEMALLQTDVNSALRKAEELANQAVRSKQAK